MVFFKEEKRTSHSWFGLRGLLDITIFSLKLYGMVAHAEERGRGEKREG